MGYAIGTGSGGRDIGYGVPATCDHPDCDEKIDRGMSYACGEFVSDFGCGLYFCFKHLSYVTVPNGDERTGLDRPLDNEECSNLCERCEKRKSPFEPKEDHPDWMWWKLKDKSWMNWRKDNRKEVDAIRNRLKKLNYEPSEELVSYLND